MKELFQIRVEGKLTTAIPSFDSEPIALVVDKHIILYNPTNGQLQPTGFEGTPYFALSDNSWLCMERAHLLSNGTLKPEDDVATLSGNHTPPPPSADGILVESKTVPHEFNTGYDVLTVKQSQTKEVMAEIFPANTYSVNRDGLMLIVGMVQWSNPTVTSHYDFYRAPDWLQQKVPCENPLAVKFWRSEMIMVASRDGMITIYDPVVTMESNKDM